MKKRFLFTGLLLIVMLMASCAVALADGDVPPQNMISDNPNFSSYEWHRMVMPYGSGDALAFTRVVASITKYSSSAVYVRGVTEVNKVTSVVGLIMYVEQWKDNAWNSYSMTSFTEYDTDSMSATKVVNVESGYYYRVVIKHRAYGVAESIYDVTNTNGILVR